MIGCFADVLNKVFSHFTALHFGRRKPNLPAFIPFHSLHTLFQHRTASVFRTSYPCFFPTLQIMVCFIFYCGVFAPLPTLKGDFSKDKKEVNRRFPKEKRIKRKAKVGGFAQAHRTKKNPKDYGIMARQIRCFAELIFLPCHPSGLIPFPFGFFAPPPDKWLSFFSVFFFVKKFWFSATATKKAELTSKIVRYESR